MSASIAPLRISRHAGFVMVHRKAPTAFQAYYFNIEFQVEKVYW